MSATTGLQVKVNEYITERRRLGFKLDDMAEGLASFARYVSCVHHRGPLTCDLMVNWARQDQTLDHKAETSARRLKMLRPFARWMRQFEPLTGLPDESVFGPIPGRVAPHIYQEAEIAALLNAARHMDPPNSLRPATFETLFGLISCAGLRVSEALNLLDSDVDLQDGTLVVRQTKFAKSRRLPLHSSTIQALAHYRQLRCQQISTTAETTFFIGTRGRLLGQPLGDRQVHRVFLALRDKLGWVNRGAHGSVRIHDMRHTFAVRTVMRWHKQGIDVDQAMLSLCTYLGHADISHTYWYLTGVPELMALAGAKFEQFAQAPRFGDE